MKEKIFRRELFRRVALLFATAPRRVGLSAEPQGQPVKVEFSHKPQAPSRIPLAPGLNIARSFFFYEDAPPRKGKRYDCAEGGGYAIHNGPDVYNHILMGEGVWYLMVGDKPRFKLFH